MLKNLIINNKDEYIELLDSQKCEINLVEVCGVKLGYIPNMEAATFFYGEANISPSEYIKNELIDQGYILNMKKGVESMFICDCLDDLANKLNSFLEDAIERIEYAEKQKNEDEKAKSLERAKKKALEMSNIEWKNKQLEDIKNNPELAAAYFKATNCGEIPKTLKNLI